MRNYRNLSIWEKGMEIAKETYLLAKELPNSEKYGLTSQITRSAVSIPSNIAEGCSRDTKNGFHYFMKVALGSCYELETQLTLITDLDIINDSSISLLKEKIIEEEKMINKTK